jgi:tyrosine-protein phosphatase YwqE
MAKRVSKGFGDTVAKFTEATGIDKLVHFIAGEDCNCDKRKEKLNKMFPYKTPECLTEVEHEQLTTLLPNMRVKVRPSEQLQFLKVYNRVFKTNEQPTSCASCLNDMLRKMKQVYNAYENEGAFLG